MQLDDMILVSIDDHMIEPPDMYKNHVPAKWADKAPKVVRNDQGIDQWVFQGEATSTPFGMAATVGWPSEEWGFDPGFVFGAAARMLRRPRAGAGHERQRRSCVDELPDHGRLQRPDLHRGRGQGTGSDRCSRPTTIGPSTSGPALILVASSRSASSRCGTWSWLSTR